jgi:hypothetical protein
MTCECKKVIETLEQERGDLAAAYNLMHSALIKEKDGRRSIEAERDELAARVERLSRVLKDCAPNLQNKDELYGLKWAVCDIINEAPAASLLLHDADIMKMLSDRFYDMGAEPHVYGKEMTFEELGDHFETVAADLRKQAAEQESK